METQASRSPPALMWIVGIAIIVFCLAGIAAIMGWIPTSIGRPGDGAVSDTLAVPHAEPAKPTAARVAPDSESHRAPVHAANAAPPAAAPGHARCAECGVIESTREVDAKGEGSGIGAVGGAVVGGLLGNQVGNGHGKEIATIVGAVGGAVGGNEIEKRVKTTKGYETIVRLDDGSSRAFHDASAPTWRNGDHVRIVDGAIRSN